MGKRSISLKTEIIIYSIILLCLTTVLVTLASTLSFSKTSKENEKAVLKQHAMFLKEQILNSGVYTENTQSFLDNYSLYNDVRLTLIDSKGDVLYESADAQLPKENHINRKEIQDALTQGEGYDERKSASFSVPYIYYATKCSASLILRVSARLDIITEHQKTYTLILLPIIVIMSLIMIALSILIYSKITKPINEVIKTANEYNKGNFNSSFTPSSIKEINILQNTLSSMATSINSQINQLSTLERTRKDFVANVSHELKTPLTAIEGFTELLLSQEKLDDENARKFLEIIYKNSNQMENIVKDLLLLSSLECSNIQYSFEKVPLKSIIEEVMNNVSYRIEKAEDTLVYDASVNDDYLLTCHKGLLVQAINNLISNAIIYSPLHSQITLKVFIENAYVCFSVKDNGIGIDKIDIDRLFERFYRVDKSRSRSSGGTGLGLSIVKHVAEIHGGKVSAFSDGIDMGSEFTIYIPK